MKAAQSLSELAQNEKPDVAIFIDSWSFSRLAAAKIRHKAPSVRRIKYVAPQVWASRPGRAKQLAQLFDGLICLFDFEAQHFEHLDVPVCVAGHSGFQAALANKGNGSDFRKRHAIGEESLLAVLPGSRRSELELHAKPFGEVLTLLQKQIPDFKVVVAAAPAVAEFLSERTKGWSTPAIIVDHKSRYDAFAAADAALTVSGTVTTELAINETPMVVCYKMDALTGIWVDLFVTAPYASLVNIAADRKVVPEFVQRNFNVPEVARTLGSLLREGPPRETQLTAFPELINQLAGTVVPAADKAAQAVIQWSEGKFPKTIE
jgi:lipid-A-disaccharide synthase